MNDADLAVKYARVLQFAAVKTWRKWRSYLVTLPESLRPFNPEDLDQWALEALYGMAGLMDTTGLGSNKGRLAEIEAEHGERYVQAAIDLYLSQQAQKAHARSKTGSRGGGEVPSYLDAPIGEDGATLGDALSPGVETSDIAMSGIAEQYPLLYLTRIEGFQWWEAAEILGVGRRGYGKIRDAELARFTEWAHKNRRVAA